MSCLIPCEPVLNTYSLKFTITQSDVSNISSSITDFWNKLNSMTIYGLPIKSLYNSESIVNIPIINQSHTVPNYCTLSTTNKGGVWIFLSSFASWFGFSTSRLCGVSATPVPNKDNITGIQIILTILPPDNTTTKRNDMLSAKCIGEWMMQFLRQYNSADDTNTNPVAFVANTKESIINKCSGFSSEINENIETYSNISEKILSGISFTNISGFEPGFENYSNIGGNRGSSFIAQPSTIWEWIFMYSYPACFLGAIFYGITSVVNVDPTSILVNRNVSVLLNGYILACSIVSICVWYNINNPILSANILNPATIKFAMQ